ncbi:16S rRNA (cytosine(1402)-N(4))-methyltransferase RsmH [Eubacteriales bacterium OttesenSCG-928-K08]|nr:16S rRNA (cytosine(1402)-N(4))-methyltransferase RsmH [Eubacteriales bacterium OttesenSCG-928-K08]
MSTYHTPIMAQEVLDLLLPERGGTFADGTLGGTGHAQLVLERLPKGSKLYGIDRDGDAIQNAQETLRAYADSFVAIRGNFFNMKELLQKEGVSAIDGALLDLGVSSHQLDEAERGFSYHQEAPLDMRMDTSASFSAYDVVNGYETQELAKIIREYGEERYAGRIAGAIVRERELQPIKTTTRLSEIVCKATPPDKRFAGQHPARRTFQAIRIEVNGELAGLENAIREIQSILRPGGRFCIITFHSLEDRIVKQLFKEWESPCVCPPKSPVCVCGKVPTAKILTKKPLIASEQEQADNPRARSAKLRAIEKLGMTAG